MSDRFTTTDPRGADGPTNPLHRAFLPWLRDERDLIFIDTIVEMSLVFYIGGALMFLAPTWLTLALGIPWLALVMARYAGRYTLMLHAVCHRKYFKRDKDWVHKWVMWGLAPFVGQTFNTFYVHHIGMHHPENNLEPDLSSTLAYRRDSFAHFLHYWGRFFFFGYAHLFRYFRSRKRKKLLKKFLVGELSWIALIAVGLFLDPAATFFVFVAPFLLMRWFMMCGNWAQHAFVDIDDPGNPYRNSTCLTNAAYNHNCFNDGYHIIHHIKPAMHWADMATWFEDNQDEFIEQDAVIFDGLKNNQVVWWLLMTGNYDKLAEHIWAPGKERRSHAERVNWLKQRVRRRLGQKKGVIEFRESKALAA